MFLDASFSFLGISGIELFILEAKEGINVEKLILHAFAKSDFAKSTINGQV